MYQAVVTTLDDMTETPIADSLDPDYSSIEWLARRKMYQEKELGSTVIRVGDTWLVSVSKYAAQARADSRSYILAIQEVTA